MFPYHRDNKMKHQVQYILGETLLCNTYSKSMILFYMFSVAEVGTPFTNYKDICGSSCHRSFNCLLVSVTGYNNGTFSSLKGKFSGTYTVFFLFVNSD